MSISAKSSRIVFIGFEGLQVLDLAGPADVFSIANNYTPNSYELIFIGTTNSISGANGMKFSLDKLTEVRPSDTIIVPGGSAESVFSAIADKELMTWLQHASSRVRRVASICSGAFILAHLGLLNNRRVVTHWDAVERLAKFAPDAQIEKDAIFIEDGNIWTSAGVTTGIDLALAMVRKDIGDKTALQIARSLVVQVIRPGNQSQYSKPLALQTQAGSSLDKLLPWLENRICEMTTVVQMAEEMGMSERQFHRQCIQQFARTPAKLVLELKLDHARNHLQNSDTPIISIGRMCGFSDRASFSKAFKKKFAVSPAMFRNHWRVDLSASQHITDEKLD